MTDRIQITRGDITAEQVDAIVNAANTDMLLGSGVAGAIRTKGGPSIQEECNRHGPVELGEAALTGGGDLPARFVIHAAAMRLGGKPTAKSIRLATLNSLKIAAEHGFESISFPALGTGVGGFGIEDAARIMVGEVKEFLKTHDKPVVVRFVLFDEMALRAFQAVQGN